MAGELQIRTQYTGETIYALVWNGTAQVLTVSGPTFGTYSTASLGNYDIPLTEQGNASSRYEGDLPAMSAGYYNVEYFLQSGGSPSETADLLIGTEFGYWDGTNWTPVTPERGTDSAYTGTPPTAADIAAAIQAATVETGLTVNQLFRIAFAALAGLSDTFAGSDAATDAHFRDKADTKNRITVTTDANGNRTAITFDLT